MNSFRRLLSLSPCHTLFKAMSLSPRCFSYMSTSRWDLSPVIISRRHSSSYEGSGKTTVTILNHEPDSPLLVDAYHENGFSLNNGFKVRGPMALFPKTVLAWDVGSAEQITPESLVLFCLLEPKLDILIIGVGDRGKTVPLETMQYLRKSKTNFEILPTEHAVATFNFLNYEKRCVAAAILPPTDISYGTEDLLRNRIDKKRDLEKHLD